MEPEKTKIMSFFTILRHESNVQSQCTSVEQSLRNQLECPVCMEYMRPPITLCVNGHNICNTCKQKLPHCPTCRQQFLNTRNVALEKLATELKYPCAYRKYGCKEIDKLDMIDGHQQKCQYIPQQCPVNKLNLGTCTWTGINSSMMSHLRQAHSDVCMDYPGHEPHGDREPFHFGNTLHVDLNYHGSVLYKLHSICEFGRIPNVRLNGHGHGSYGNLGPLKISGVTPATKHCKLIFCYNAVFCSRSETKNGIFYSVLQYIGPATNAAKYKYKLKFFNKLSTESLAVTRLARSLDEDLCEVHNSGNCVKLYPEQFNGFANERNELEFSMKILKC